MRKEALFDVCVEASTYDRASEGYGVPYQTGFCDKKAVMERFHLTEYKVVKELSKQLSKAAAFHGSNEVLQQLLRKGALNPSFDWRTATLGS